MSYKDTILRAKSGNMKGVKIDDTNITGLLGYVFVFINKSEISEEESTQLHEALKHFSARNITHRKVYNKETWSLKSNWDSEL